MAEDSRPNCPKCGREMIFIAIAAAGRVIRAWTCDCEYREEPELTPPGLIRDILECREFDTWAIAYNVSLFEE